MSGSVNTPDIGAFAASLGIDVAEWRDGFARLTMPVQPWHLNRSGVLHGGIVAALIDTACGYAGTWCATPGHVRWAVTLSLTTQFTGQARDGTLTAIGRRRGGGRRIFFASAEVLDGTGAVIGFGDATLRYRSGSDDPAGVPFRPPGQAEA